MFPPCCGEDVHFNSLFMSREVGVHSLKGWFISHELWLLQLSSRVPGLLPSTTLPRQSPHSHERAFWVSLHFSLSGLRFPSFWIMSCWGVCVLPWAGQSTLPSHRSRLWAAYWPLQSRKYKGHTLPRAFTPGSPYTQWVLFSKTMYQTCFVSDLMLRFYSLGILPVYSSVVGVRCCRNTEVIHGFLSSKSSNLRADMTGAQIIRNCGKP